MHRLHRHVLRRVWRHVHRHAVVPVPPHPLCTCVHRCATADPPAGGRRTTNRVHVHRYLHTHVYTHAYTHVWHARPRVWCCCARPAHGRGWWAGNSDRARASARRCPASRGPPSRPRIPPSCQPCAQPRVQRLEWSGLGFEVSGFGVRRSGLSLRDYWVWAVEVLRLRIDSSVQGVFAQGPAPSA